MDEYPFNASEVAAIKAWQAGKANEGQQQMAWLLVLNGLGMVLKGSFDPTGKKTDFNEGRRYVARQLLRATELTPAKGKKPSD